MYDRTLKSIFKISDIPEELKVIYLYRYFSLFLISLFYLTSDLKSLFPYKAVVFICLSISSVILNELYIKNRNAGNIIKLLVMIELIGNTLLLIPTGGFSSPYIWYSLNTIFVTIYFLNMYYCCMVLFTYLVLSSIISLFVLNNNQTGIAAMLLGNSNLLLSFILITAAAQLLTMLVRRLHSQGKDLAEANKQLTEANNMIKGSLEHIMALYQAVNSLTGLEEKDKLMSLITYYTLMITKAPLSFFCINSNNKLILDICGETEDDFKKKLTDELEARWPNLHNSSGDEICINNKNILVTSVKTSHNLYGVLGIELHNEDTNVLHKENVNQLMFLSSLASIVFERFQLEEINHHLMINEEQNRIADEIHDSVSQRLFAVSCSLNALAMELDSSLTPESIKEIIIIRNSLNKAMKELREKIYGLSWKKTGPNIFEHDIKRYLKDLMEPNNVEIFFNINGNQDLICFKAKTALYRIISESAGNAVHHGKCKLFEVNLNIGNTMTELKITDDGMGFDLENTLSSGNVGLGIRNMYSLVYSLNGSISIETGSGIGTAISISIPNSQHLSKSQGEAV